MNIRKTMIAGLAGVALIAAGSIAAPSTAHAGGKLWGAAALGFLAGSVIASQHVYGAPVVYGYGAPVYQPTCWLKQQFTGYYNAYGQPIYKNVQFCS